MLPLTAARPYFFEQRAVALFAGANRGDLRAEIAHREFRHAHVRADDARELVVLHAALEDLDDRQLQALGVDVLRAAAERAADIDPMRHRRRERHDLAVVKDRQREDHVVEMAAHDVGVVGQQNVAGLDAVGSVELELRFDRIGEAANEHRQTEADRDRVAVRIEEADGVVERFVDDRIVGGPHEVRFHLIGDRDQRVADDLGGDRIVSSLRHASTVRIMWPEGWTSTRTPGGTTVAEPSSCTIAGPANASPASSLRAIVDRRFDSRCADRTARVRCPSTASADGFAVAGREVGEHGLAQAGRRSTRARR